MKREGISGTGKHSGLIAGTTDSVEYCNKRTSATASVTVVP